MPHAITTHLEAILQKQREIGHTMPKYVRPGLTEQAIRDLETRCGMHFNEELRAYFRFMDGVDLSPTNMAEETLLHPFLRPASSIDILRYVVEERYFQQILEGWEYPDLVHECSPLHVPIIVEGANCFWVNLDPSDRWAGYVLETTMWGDFQYVCTSLTQLFYIIRMAYEKGYFFVGNKSGELEWGSSAFYDLAHQISPLWSK